MRVKMTRSRRLTGTSVAVVATAALAAACGAGPNAPSGDTDDFDDAVEETSASLEEVYEQVEGLTGQARRDKLIELAEAEGGSIVWYTAAADDDTTPLIQMFNGQTGLDVEVYRASSDTVLSRTIEEAQAGEIRGDVLNFSGMDPTIASHEGLYATPLDTPLADEMAEETVHEDWIADQFYPFIVAWNTDRLGSAPAPETMTDVLTQFEDGELALESTDSLWLFEVVQLLQEEEEMSEQEAIDLVAAAAEKAVPIRGHTLTSELLGSGQYVAAATTYHYRTVRMEEAGASIAWEPQPRPVLSTVSGTGISATTPRPAAALLFVEFQLTEEQEYWTTAGRMPTNENYEGGLDTDEYELRVVDHEAMYAEIQKWDDLYAEMMRSSDREIQGDQ